VPSQIRPRWRIRSAFRRPTAPVAAESRVSRPRACLGVPSLLVPQSMSLRKRYRAILRWQREFALYLGDSIKS
jgi:hypothetical protein